MVKTFQPQKGNKAPKTLKHHFHPIEDIWKRTILYLFHPSLEKEMLSNCQKSTQWQHCAQLQL
jgi:hypothetical protein